MTPGSANPERTGRSTAPRFLRNAVVLGLLTAIGPFAIDMYLPSLPSIGTGLGVDSDAVLRTLTAFFVTFALGQLVYGPISDMVGRKPPLYAGIVIFAGASIGCALAEDIHTLVVFRLIQGMGGAAGIVVSRAIVRDLHSGLDEARLLSLLMLVFSVSPILAPLIGSTVIEVASWRAVFWLVTGIALLGLVLLAGFVPETRPPAARSRNGLSDLFAASRTLLSDRGFLGLTFVSALALGGFFAFLANSSFVLMGQYGLSPTAYSLVFSVNAAAFFAAMQLSGRLGLRYGLARIVRPAVLGYAATMLLLLGLTTAGIDGLPVLVGLLFLGYAFVGLVLPVSSVLALADHGEHAGTAASLMAAIQLATGVVVLSLGGLVADGTAATMMLSIAGCAAAAALLAQVMLGGRRTAAGSAD